jgi:hypothetical protein
MKLEIEDPTCKQFSPENRGGKYQFTSKEGLAILRYHQLILKKPMLIGENSMDCKHIGRKIEK